METNAKELFDRLARIELVDVPEGEAGVPVLDESGATRHCVPVLSVYLDARPMGSEPERRASAVLLRERLHQIAETFWPRGFVYQSIQEDRQRIEDFLNTSLPPTAHGIAIFASSAHHLFATFSSDAPFETTVSALAMPDLFQLAGLLDDHEVAVVAVAHTHAVRLFVTHRGGMREVRGLATDQKFFHQVRRTNAMNQAHYQRHARQTRADFARTVASEIENLVRRTGAHSVILGGDAVAVPVLRQALPPDIAELVSEPRIPLAMEAEYNTIWEEVEPVLEEAQSLHEHSVAEQLIEAVRADRLGVAGIARTREALEAGQADVLVIAKDASVMPEERSELLALAAKTDAEVDVVEPDASLGAIGGVGAMLRYRVHA